MSTSLRSLSGLIDFECAARWGSFRLAAAELHKTPAAVSLQVKQLEQALGFPLFVRHPRRIVLSAKGQEFAVTVTRTLQELQAKVGALRDGDEESVLRISTTHSFAMKWLVPRLHRFSARHPQFDLRIDSNDQPVSLEDGGCDLALRYARLSGGDMADLLYREQFVVACSPGLLPRPHKHAAPHALQELLRQPLLYEGTPELWLRLLEANGVRGRRLDFSQNYSHAGLVVQSAVAGLGVALVPFSLACEDIAQGRLVACVCLPLPARYGYRLLCSERKRTMPKVQHFSAWLHAEVASMERHFHAFYSASRG